MFYKIIVIIFYLYAIQCETFHIKQTNQLIKRHNINGSNVTNIIITITKQKHPESEHHSKNQSEHRNDHKRKKCKNKNVH